MLTNQKVLQWHTITRAILVTKNTVLLLTGVISSKHPTFTTSVYNNISQHVSPGHGIQHNPLPLRDASLARRALGGGKFVARRTIADMCIPNYERTSIDILPVVVLYNNCRKRYMQQIMATCKLKISVCVCVRI